MKDVCYYKNPTKYNLLWLLLWGNQLFFYVTPQAQATKEQNQQIGHR